MRTLSDNSRGCFVRHAARESHDFRGEVRIAVDISSVICRLRASSCGAVRCVTPVPATSCALHAKSTLGQNAKIPEAPGPIVRCVQVNRGTIRGTKAVSQAKRRAEGQRRRAKPRQPLGHRQSSPQPPDPSPQKTWRVREKLGEFEETRGFSTTTTWRVREKRRVKRQESRANPVTSHRSSFINSFSGNTNESTTAPTSVVPTTPSDAHVTNPSLQCK